MSVQIHWREPSGCLKCGAFPEDGPHTRNLWVTDADAGQVTCNPCLAAAGLDPAVRRAQAAGRLINRRRVLLAAMQMYRMTHPEEKPNGWHSLGREARQNWVTGVIQLLESLDFVIVRE